MSTSASGLHGKQRAGEGAACCTCLCQACKPGSVRLHAAKDNMSLLLAELHAVGCYHAAKAVCESHLLSIITAVPLPMLSACCNPPTALLPTLAVLGPQSVQHLVWHPPAGKSIDKLPAAWHGPLTRQSVHRLTSRPTARYSFKQLLLHSRANSPSSLSTIWRRAAAQGRGMYSCLGMRRLAASSSSCTFQHCLNRGTEAGRGDVQLLGHQRQQCRAQGGAWQRNGSPRSEWLPGLHLSSDCRAFECSIGSRSQYIAA